MNIFNNRLKLWKTSAGDTHSHWAALYRSGGSMKGRKKGEDFTPADHSRVIHMARKRSKASKTHHRMSLGV